MSRLKDNGGNTCVPIAAKWLESGTDDDVSFWDHFHLFTIYRSGFPPVVRAPLVVRSHLPGGPRARTSIYLNLRETSEKGNFL